MNGSRYIEFKGTIRISEDELMIVAPGYELRIPTNTGVILKFDSCSKTRILQPKKYTLKPHIESPQNILQPKINSSGGKILYPNTN